MFILEPDPLGGRRPKRYPTIEAARAAAQADYEARTRPALEDTGEPALISRAILDAQLRCMERGRLDTPDEIRAAAAALRKDEEPK